MKQSDNYSGKGSDIFQRGFIDFVFRQPQAKFFFDELQQGDERQRIKAVRDQIGFFRDDSLRAEDSLTQKFQQPDLDLRRLNHAATGAVARRILPVTAVLAMAETKRMRPGIFSALKWVRQNSCNASG